MQYGQWKLESTPCVWKIRNWVHQEHSMNVMKLVMVIKAKKPSGSHSACYIQRGAWFGPMFLTQDMRIAAKQVEWQVRYGHTNSRSTMCKGLDSPDTGGVAGRTSPCIWKPPTSIQLFKDHTDTWLTSVFHWRLICGKEKIKYKVHIISFPLTFVEVEGFPPSPPHAPWYAQPDNRANATTVNSRTPEMRPPLWHDVYPWSGATPLISIIIWQLVTLKLTLIWGTFWTIWVNTEQ